MLQAFDRADPLAEVHPHLEGGWDIVVAGLRNAVLRHQVLAQCRHRRDLYGQHMTADRAEHLRTAPEVAGSLGIDARTLRAWLRETYKRVDDDHGAQYLTRDMVNAAERRFCR